MLLSFMMFLSRSKQSKEDAVEAIGPAKKEHGIVAGVGDPTFDELLVQHHTKIFS